MPFAHPRLPVLWLSAGVVVALVCWLGGRGTKKAGGPERSDRAVLGEIRPLREPVPMALSQPVGTLNTSVADGMALFQFADVPEAAELDAALPAPARRIDYVRLNGALLTGKRSPFWARAGEGRVAVPLPEGGALDVVIDGSEMLGADRFVSAGHIAGRPGSRAFFAGGGGFLHATIEDPVLGTRVLRVVTRELAQFYTIDPARVPPCGGERRTFVDGEVLAAAAARRMRAAELARVAAAPRAVSEGDGSPAIAPLAASVNPQRAEAHVMLVVTQSVLSTLGGAERMAALRGAFDVAIARVNADLAASLVTTRVRLVKIAETRYDETVSVGGKVLDDALTAIQSATDGKMDEIHALRDASGADFVCLVVNRSEFASSGLAFVLDKAGDTTNALFAFSVVQYASFAGTSVVSHEFGHMFGCAHDRENAKSPGTYPYSYGYQFIGADGLRYRDIMAYPPGIELPYFSNPAIVAPEPAGVPLGIEAGRAGESDCARTIEQAAHEVAGFRLQTIAPPAAGTLVNLATRASVGPGERAAIAGFVVSGSQPKTLLLRAAGPGLAAFGVRDALGAPALELYSGATRVAENSGWAGAANAAAIASAASQVGAFAFAPASADSALLVTLAPGAYTAVVRSEAATGSVLLEAYETTATAGRLVNLSTRAYADHTGRPLIAGFVVRGAPGTTKRMLVRALGPTLSRPPFAIPTAMDDPRMEIRDAAGALILQNDDWSRGAEGGASAENDFKPLVRYYNEQQIAATGLAPTNRREPCLLADLPPGSYTVVVMPFESLPEEPAKPGVALVEVFEVGGGTD